jgi:hypothetical protein
MCLPLRLCTRTLELPVQGIFTCGLDLAMTERFGAGIRAGIDYMHPDLGGGFGPGFKVAKGYDFVGDNGFIPGAPQTMCGMLMV